MLKFEHFVINHDHLQLNTQRVWHTGEVSRDYFMVNAYGFYSRVVKDR